MLVLLQKMAILVHGSLYPPIRPLALTPPSKNNNSKKNKKNDEPMSNNHRSNEQKRGTVKRKNSQMNKQTFLIHTSFGYCIYPIRCRFTLINHDYFDLKLT